VRGGVSGGLSVLLCLGGCAQLRPNSPIATQAPAGRPQAVAQAAPEDRKLESSTVKAPVAMADAVSPRVASTEPATAGASRSPKPSGARKVAASTTVRAQPPHKAPVAVVAAVPPPSPALDLAALEQRLRDTHAIGVFTKLSLKNQVDDLLDQFRGFYQGHLKIPLAVLRQRYDLLLLKVLSLLQDADQQLAMAIASSRETIWRILADPEKFSKI
jgi:hypothetical protein